jgi:polar amino acid transport system substrate-binding protein
MRTATLALVITAQQVSADTTLPAVNSYGQPPFVAAGNEQGAGLAGTFVALLNAALPDGAQLRLETLPRRRLELALTSRTFSGVALFLAPEFLAAPIQQGGAWSVPVMVDENMLVSVRPLKMSTLDDLHGLRFGAISGHIYRMLAPALEAGKVERQDTTDHISNLHKLCLGRIDFVVISRSELAGTLPHVRCAHAFRPTAFPEPQVIVRRVLVRMSTDGGAQEMLDAIAETACGSGWTAALGRYGLSTVGCRSNSLAKTGDTGSAEKRDRKIPLSKGGPS